MEWWFVGAYLKDWAIQSALLLTKQYKGRPLPPLIGAKLTFLHAPDCV